MTTMSKIFIIAGNFDQFKFYRKKLVELMREQDLDFNIHDIVYLYGPENIRGYREPWGYRVGSWSERKDLSEIVQQLLICGSSLTESFMETDFA